MESAAMGGERERRWDGRGGGERKRRVDFGVLLWSPSLFPPPRPIARNFSPACPFSLLPLFRLLLRPSKKSILPSPLRFRTLDCYDAHSPNRRQSHLSFFLPSAPPPYRKVVTFLHPSLPPPFSLRAKSIFVVHLRCCCVLTRGSPPASASASAASFFFPRAHSHRTVGRSSVGPPKREEREARMPPASSLPPPTPASSSSSSSGLSLLRNLPVFLRSDGGRERPAKEGGGKRRRRGVLSYTPFPSLLLGGRMKREQGENRERDEGAQSCAREAGGRGTGGGGGGGF